MLPFISAEQREFYRLILDMRRVLTQWETSRQPATAGLNP
jgi:hypothetical protein